MRLNTLLKFSIVSSLWILSVYHPVFAAIPNTQAPASVADPLISQALLDPERPQADKERDSLRKPQELLVFAGIKPGDQVVDLLPGGGYFTRLFSRLVGAQGKVYSLVPSNSEKLSPKFAEMLKKGQQGMQDLAQTYHNLTPLAQSLDALSLPENLDLVWTSQNYHDIYGYWGAETMARTNVAIFKALKPGGSYIVIDHVGARGADLEAATSVHRIDPETVKKQVEAAGFVLAEQSLVLHNPQDKYELSVFDPSLRGHTDQFVYKFRKP